MPLLTQRLCVCMCVRLVFNGCCVYACLFLCTSVHMCVFVHALVHSEAEELYQKRVLTITGICVALLVVGIVCVVAYCKTK